jgi:hypothetical protein
MLYVLVQSQTAASVLVRGVVELVIADAVAIEGFSAMRSRCRMDDRGRTRFLLQIGL